MSTIHVNTDVMRHVGQLFVQLNQQIENQIQPQILHGISQLEGDWKGVSRQHFEGMFQEWRALTARIIANGEEIGQHLQFTAQRFENADQSS